MKASTGEPPAGPIEVTQAVDRSSGERSAPRRGTGSENVPCNSANDNDILDKVLF